MTSYEGGTSASILDSCENMNEFSTGRVYHITLPRNNLSDYGSVRSIDMTWGRTGVRVRHACHYPLHPGRKKELKTRNVVNNFMSSERTKLDSTATFCDKYSIEAFFQS